MVPHPNPALESARQSARVTNREAQASRAVQRPQSLTNMFPSALSIPVWFDKITVPAGLAAPAAGISYLYGLRRLVVGNNGDIVRNAAFYGAYFQLRPTDWNGKGTGGGAGSSGSWGDNRGEKAAIVIGRNLQNFREGGFTEYRAAMPGIDGHNAGVVDNTRVPSFLMTQTFPPGDWGDTAPQLALVPRTLAPAATRLIEGNTLDVGLLLNGAQVAAISAGVPKTIIGYANIDIYVVSTDQDTDFRQ